MATLFHTSNHSSETRPNKVSALGISTSPFLLAPNSPAPSSIIGMGILQSQVGGQTAQVTQGPMSARIQGSEGLASWPFFGLVRASALVTLSLQGSHNSVTQSKVQSSPSLSCSFSNWYLLAEQVTRTPMSSPSAAKLQRRPCKGSHRNLG